MTDVILATTFLESVAKLPMGDRGRFFSLQTKFVQSLANASASLERLHRAKASNVWSARASQELRAILHKDGPVWIFVYGGRHDQAYKWAENHDVKRHGTTGQLQIVAPVEPGLPTATHAIVRRPSGPRKPPIFARHRGEYLLSVGVPENWLQTIRELRSEEDLYQACEKLPEDVADMLLRLADGEPVVPPEPLPRHRPITEAPGMQSRFFFVSDDVQGLRAALQAPLERWIAFLHPDQRSMVERTFNGPAKVSGSAGTGKTVVAMHRARALARRGEQVLLTTYTRTLARNLRRGLGMLCSDEELKSVDVRTVDSASRRIARKGGVRVRPDTNRTIPRILEECRSGSAPFAMSRFVEQEWDRVIQMQGIESWDDYRDARRIGRGTRLATAERRQLWPVFKATLGRMGEEGICTWDGMATIAGRLLRDGKVASPYTAVIVDEVQDLTVSKLRFLRALCESQPQNFMVCGDAGQRIYPGGFSLRALGIEVRGRSTVLGVNYRTSKQIQVWADGVRAAEVDDMDGHREERVETRSVFRGPEPRGIGARTRAEEAKVALEAIQEWLRAGYGIGEIAVFAPAGRLLEPLQQELDRSKVAWSNLAQDGSAPREAMQMGTMHRAKGLEFKVVAVIGCEKENLPGYHARKIEDPVERRAAIDLQRNLLYAAMTRARDELVVTWAGQPSPFLAAIAQSDSPGESPSGDLTDPPVR